MNYYIQGNKEKADQIKAAFEAKGFIPRIAPMYYGSESVLFFTGTDNYIYETPSPWVMDIIKTHPDYKELELPKPHYDIANFKPKQWVLTRDTSEWDWELTMFAYLNSDGVSKFTCINGVTFKQCIPYNDDTKHLLGTTDPCDEQYINW